ncbi:MAG: FAD-dependent oxidoreductase [Candidatus Odinarchaeia archaeon]
MASQVVEVSVDTRGLLPKISELATSKARFITITCKDLSDFFEIIYHFEKDSKVVNIKVKMGKNEVLPSITSIYPCAFLAENEVKDMFNLNILGLKPDFGGRLLKTVDATQTTLLKPALGVQPPLFRVKARCAQQCPAGIDVPRYIRLIGEGKYMEAFQTILERAPFPAILGRVCFAPCEDGCRQAKNGQPIAIRLLKRFVADYVGVKKLNVERSKSTGKRVAVIGAGPAGLTAAYYLGLLGHEVTVFDELPKPGGMMLVGIPEYRLPKKLMMAEINARMEEAEVELKLKRRIEDLDALLGEGYNAIFIAIGAHQSIKLGIEGEDHPKVIDCLQLLREVNVHGRRPKLGEKVVIIGGGNSALDAARVSLRLGVKEVIIFYRRTRMEMPATPRELEEAEAEGVKFEFLATPTKVLSSAEEPPVMEFIRMKLTTPDESGRLKPQPIPGTEFIVEADTFIKAIGEVVTVPKIFNLDLTTRGRIKVNPETLQTSKLGVFAGGDVVSGPASVTNAIGDGWKAASAIDKYLGGYGLREYELVEELIPRVEVKEVLGLNRTPVALLPVEERIKGFSEVELGYKLEEAIKEAKRCWRCDWYE